MTFEVYRRDLHRSGPKISMKGVMVSVTGKGVVSLTPDAWEAILRPSRLRVLVDFDEQLLRLELGVTADDFALHTNGRLYVATLRAPLRAVGWTPGSPGATQRITPAVRDRGLEFKVAA